MAIHPSSTTSDSAIRTLKMVFYGAGPMAEAIVRGILERDLTDPGQITMINRQNAARLEELQNNYMVRTPHESNDKQNALKNADIIFLAMKPKDAAEAIRELRGIVTPGHLIVSVIAGLSIRTIRQLLDTSVPIVRTMPNTSSTIGLGATGISFSSDISEIWRTRMIEIFQSIGVTAVVDEPLLDSVTGLSGSGPAYVYYLMESLVKAGQLLGLSEEASKMLTVQTVLGAAQMVMTTGEQPAELRRKVTSPNGTTQAAIEILDAHHFTDAVTKAVFRAAERAGELGEMIERSASSK
ncbi:pyrroline-5-carboxylate reductase [Paenibacillus tarimensis]